MTALNIQLQPIHADHSGTGTCLFSVCVVEGMRCAGSEQMNDIVKSGPSCLQYLKVMQRLNRS